MSTYSQQRCVTCYHHSTEALGSRFRFAGSIELKHPTRDTDTCVLDEVQIHMYLIELQVSINVSVPLVGCTTGVRVSCYQSTEILLNRSLFAGLF